MSLKSQMFFGIDRFLFESNHALRSKKIGLLTNSSATTTSIPAPNMPSRQALEKAGIYIVCLFFNKYGLYLEGNQKPFPSTDPLTQKPLVNLFEIGLEELIAQVEHLDAIVVDIPDTGIRYLSDYSSLAKLLHAAQETEIPVWVFDRPNPLGGMLNQAEGPIENKGTDPVNIRLPVRHSLTIGEIAHMWQHENGMKLDLHIIPMGGWKRKMMWPQISLPKTPTHPQIVDFRSHLVAACSAPFGCLNINIGLNCPLAFRIIGAPWIDPNVLIAAVNENPFPGVSLQPLYFRPSSPPYQGQLCGGLLLHITSALKFKPVATALRLLHLLLLTYPNNCDWQSSNTQSKEPTSTFDSLLGIQDISNDLPKLPYSRKDHLSVWTEARSWNSYVRDWLLYS